MFCVKCGVELTNGQAVCPVCNTKVCHPDFPVSEDGVTYPKKEFQSEEFNRKGLLFVITIIFALPIVISLLLEITMQNSVSWSGYVTGGVLLGYLMFILPAWFKNPNPVIFAPCDFAGICVLLLYISLQTRGGWFLSFAFPVTAVFGAIVTTVIALYRYIGRGRLYIVGGGLIALGVWTCLVEFFIRLTFNVHASFIWSLCPLATLFVIGMMLIIIGIVKPLKESLRKVFYLG
ncbi:MAG: hypothetical protein IKL40_03970 [Clostridia bacterium]|nr:hypothetical protein [Clostridia bacterium]